jgi:hypothetical protein
MPRYHATNNASKNPTNPKNKTNVNQKCRG